MGNGILLVEDLDTVREMFTAFLSAQGYAVDGAESLTQAKQLLDTNSYGCIICDLRLPDGSGFDLLKKCRQAGFTIPFFMMSGYGSIELAVQAIKEGATEFLVKPFEPEALIEQLKNLTSISTTDSNQRIIVTRDARMLDLLERAKKVARVDSSVFIFGESGTGKELFARFIHQQSSRSDKPFVALNCAAVPAELLESELFGHEQGAFTGAVESKIGLFELASEGTLFLDEVGDMPPLLQVKILRALQEREIKRVGGTKTIRVSPRIISATNRSVTVDTPHHGLREDLYYRLAVILFTLPPLRDRIEDIGPIVESILESLQKRMKRSAITITPEALALLQAHSWPGNIRELENVLERSAALGVDVITPEILALPTFGSLEIQEEGEGLLSSIAHRAAREAEVHAIRYALRETNGNRSKAAKLLGVSYKTLLNKIRLYETLILEEELLSPKTEYHSVQSQ